MDVRLPFVKASDGRISQNEVGNTCRGQWLGRWAGALLFTDGRHSIRKGLFRKPSVIVEATKQVIPLRPSQHQYFKALCKELRHRGVPPLSAHPIYVRACRDFCEAVIADEASCLKYFARSPANAANRALSCPNPN
jgi:hypothetical protein